MGKDLSKILVVDLEASCWETKNEIPAGEESEIIQIGAAFYDVKTGEVSNLSSFYIKPEKSKISEFCTKLTGIVEADVINQPLLADVLKDFTKKFTPYSYTWASYGDYDREMFRKQCKIHRLDYPFSKTHINVKNLFALRQELQRELGMDKALEYLKIPLEGRHHNAMDDVRNMCKILKVNLKG